MFRIKQHEEKSVTKKESKAYDDFQLKFDLQFPEFSNDSNEQIFYCYFRKQTPYIPNHGKTPDSYGFMPAAEYKYYFSVASNGDIGIHKAYKRIMITTTNEDGKEVNVAKDKIEELAKSKITISPNSNYSFEIIVDGPVMKVSVGGELLLEVADEFGYSNGYITMKAFNYSLNVKNLKIDSIESKLRILDIKPTPFFTKGTQVTQLVKIDINNSYDKKISCFAAIYADDIQISSYEIPEISPNQTQCEIYIPDMDKEFDLKVKVYKKGGANPLCSKELVWEKQKKWKLFIAVSAHEDIGYCDHVNQLKNNLSEYIDTVKEIIDLYRDKKEGIPYKYIIEHFWWLFGYRDVRGEKEFKEFVDNYINEDYVEALAVHSGSHTHWNGDEQLVRSTYYARKEAKDRYGIDSTTAYYADTPGISWSAAQVFAKAGIKYIINAKGPWRRERENTTLPQMFYWVGPNKKDKVLHYWKWGYSDDALTEFFKEGFQSLENNLTDYIGKFQDVKYDALFTPCYLDNERPNISIIDNIQRWNKKWAYPEIKLSTMKEYFEYIEDEYSDDIPELSGDINNAWADYATIDPNSMSKKRKASEIFTTVEMLSVLAKSLDEDYIYPYNIIYDTIWRLMEFDDHTWATMLPPTSMNILNNSIVKKANVDWVFTEINKSLKKVLDSLNSKILLHNKYNIVVWNVLAQKQTNIAEFDISACPYPNFKVRDIESGEIIPWQQIADNKALFIAEDVPAMGYKRFAFEENLDQLSEKTMQDVNTNTVSNSYYDIKIDKEKKCIIDIYDKQLKKGILDQKSEFNFNEFLYVTTEEKTSPDFIVNRMTTSSISVESGQVANIITIKGQEKVSGAKIEQRIILYNRLKRIDIANRQYDVKDMLFKGSVSDSYGDVGNRYLGNVFYSFPFNVANFDFNTELACGVMNEANDRLDIGVKDYVMAQNWVDVSNNEYGVALYTQDAPTVHLGKIMYNQFDRTYKPDKSHIFVYAASNRMAGLHTRKLDDSNCEFKFSIISHESNWSEGNIPKESRGLSRNLLASVVNGNKENTIIKGNNSFMDINCDNVNVLSIKNAENTGKGIIVRFLETNGLACKVKVNISFMNLDEAWLTSIVEEDIEKLNLSSENEIEFEIEPFDHVTIRLIGASENNCINKIENIAAKAINDSSVEIEWEYGSKAGFNVYRSELEDFEVSIYNHIGYTKDCHFKDDWLDLNTEYYYRIATIDKWNNQGPVSSVVKAITDTKNTSAPKTIEELHVITIDSNTLNLWWKSCTQKDVKSYEIHRSKEPGFLPSPDTCISVMSAEPYYIHTYEDNGLDSNTLYYYCIRPIDTAENIQEDFVYVSESTV